MAGYLEDVEFSMGRVNKLITSHNNGKFAGSGSSYVAMNATSIAH